MPTETRSPSHSLRSKNIIESLPAYSNKIDFGMVSRAECQEDTYRKLNQILTLLCKSLPESIQTDAMLFCMEFTHISLGEEVDFFRKYPVPSWSILYWLAQVEPKTSLITNQDMDAAITSHAMAMLLHWLDDHLNDGEIPATHLNLLIRSQAWMFMSQANDILSKNIDDGKETSKRFIDAYYSSIVPSLAASNLDAYCARFRDQMATWMIVPVLLMKKTNQNSAFIRNIQQAYGSFGVAWRLLDDIWDLEEDMSQRTHTSIFVSLSAENKILWDKNPRGKADTEQLIRHIAEHKIVEQNLARIENELESAISIATSNNMTGYADELRCLLSPLHDH